MRKVLAVVFVMLAICTAVFPSFLQAAQVHRAVQGESLYQIASKHGVTLDKLLAKNKYLRHPGIIFPGQILIVPIEEQPQVYLVQAGDTLYQIAKEIGVPAADLAQKNNLNNWNYLYIGQALKIPPENQSAQATYQVKPGDSLFSISQQLGIPITSLALANNIINWDLLHTGQILKIPTAHQEQKPSFPYSIAQLAQIFQGTFYLRGTSNSSKIALTFDDGPDSIYTPMVLDVLSAHNVPATFFLIGENAQKHPGVVKRIIRERHVIGNHSWSHPDLREIPAAHLHREIEKTQDTLEAITGLRTSLLRPPYGAVSESVLNSLQKMGYKVINWSVDSWDWRDKDVDQILINTMPDVREEAILLFHSAGSGDMTATVEALPEIITSLKMQGYTFVTVDELLNTSAYKEKD